MIKKGVQRISRVSVRYNSSKEAPLYLNPHLWEGLPSDRIFELHNLRKDKLKENYNPNDEERRAVLSTIRDLSEKAPPLEYVYESDVYKQRVLNNVEVEKVPKRSNVPVYGQGETESDLRRRHQLNRVSAYEMPLLAKFRQQYQPKSDTETPLKLSYVTDFSSASNSSNRIVTLSVALKDLNLDEKQQKKFKILSGNKYNHHKDILKFSVDENPQPTQNARVAVEKFSRLLKEAKDLTDDFSDIPVDTRHMKPKKTAPKFPDSWKKPQNASAVPHNISKKLIDRFITKKDQQYVEKFSP